MTAKTLSGLPCARSRSALELDYLKGLKEGNLVRIDRKALVFVSHSSPVNSVVSGLADAGRTYSQLTLDELKGLYRNTTGYEFTGTEYNAAIQACKALGMRRKDKMILQVDPTIVSSVQGILDEVAASGVKVEVVATNMVQKTGSAVKDEWYVGRATSGEKDNMAKKNEKKASETTKSAEASKTTSPTQPAPPPAAQKPEPPAAKDQRNGVTRPKAGTLTGKVWDIADKISEGKQTSATKAEVSEQATKLGINSSTTATQYGKWRKYWGLKKEPKPQASEESKSEPEKAAEPSEAVVDGDSNDSGDEDTTVEES